MSGWTATEGEGGAREAVRVTFTLSEEDLGRGTRELPALRRILRMWGVGYLLLPIAWWLLGGLHSTESLSTLVGIEVFGVALWYFVAVAPAKRQHRLMKDAERTITYEFTPGGFSSESPGASSHVDYSRVHRFVDAKHSLLIFCNSITAQVVPKRAFAPGELETVQRWLQASIKPRPAKTFPVRTVLLWAVLIAAFLAIWLLLSPTSP